jgi:hypothetical protein
MNNLKLERYEENSGTEGAVEDADRQPDRGLIIF